VKETNEIYQEMKDELERRTGISFNNGGDMALRLYAVAAELSTLWAQVEWTGKQAFPQTASGEMLDMHAKARGLERGSSTAAMGRIRFEIDTARSSDITIDSGAVCLNAGGMEFFTTSSATIKAGQLYCEAPAFAKKAGAAGNVPAQSITFMALAPIGVVRCYNPSPFSGGSDGESDEMLRARILKSYANLPNGSNKAFYESVALNTDGVSAVSVVPRARGLGTVDIVISSASGLPNGNLIDSIRAKFEKQREICVDVNVLAPRTVTVPVSVAIDVDEGHDFAIVAAKVATALNEYFNGKLLGKDILLAKLGNVVFGVEGVSNYSFLQPATDIPIAYDQLPIAGTVSVTRR
jgi:uncharacterized phage protein gp47/JayE